MIIFTNQDQCGNNNTGHIIKSCSKNHRSFNIQILQKRRYLLKTDDDVLYNLQSVVIVFLLSSSKQSARIIIYITNYIYRLHVYYYIDATTPKSFIFRLWLGFFSSYRVLSFSFDSHPTAEGLSPDSRLNIIIITILYYYVKSKRQAAGRERAPQSAAVATTDVVATRSVPRGWRPQGYPRDLDPCLFCRTILYHDYYTVYLIYIYIIYVMRVQPAAGPTCTENIRWRATH